MLLSVKTQSKLRLKVFSAHDLIRVLNIGVSMVVHGVGKKERYLREKNHEYITKQD